MANFWIDLPVLQSGGGGGGGVGTVTSVNATTPSSGFLNVSGGPITASGTLSFSFQNENQNTFFAAPSTGQGQPTFRAITLSDLPNLSTGITNIGVLDGNGKSTSGLSLSGNTLFTQSADQTNPGLLTATTQTIGGDKDFKGAITLDNYLILNNSVTFTPTLNASSGASLDLAQHATDYIQFTSTALTGLGSINNQTIASGHNVLITNKTINPIRLINQYSGTPAPSAPLVTGYGQDVVLPSSGSALFIYDGPANSWFLANSTIKPPLFASSGVVPVSQGGTGLSAVGNSGNVLTSDGTNWNSSPPPGGGGASTGLPSATNFGTGVIYNGTQWIASTAQPTLRFSSNAGNLIVKQTSAYINYSLLAFNNNASSAISVISGSTGWRAIANAPGQYLVKAAVSFNAVANTTNGQLQLYKNYLPWSLLDQNSVPSGQAWGLNGSAYVNLNVNDFVSIAFFNKSTTGMSLNATSSFNYFEIMKI